MMYGDSTFWLLYGQTLVVAPRMIGILFSVLPVGNHKGLPIHELTNQPLSVNIFQKCFFPSLTNRQFLSCQMNHIALNTFDL